MEKIFLDITVIIAIASVLSIIFRFFKQPPILAYIITGILLGPLGLFQLTTLSSLHALAQVGITLVLFMLGLELRLKELRIIGKTALLGGIAQIVLTGVFVYFISTLLGFSSLVSLYIGIALTFSSTIVVVKFLSDRKNLASLYGKISIGILLVQDFVAIFMLMFLSGLKDNASISLLSILLVFLKGGVLLLWMYAASKTVLPFILKFASKSTEALFLFSLAWVFLVAALVSSSPFHFSIEMGGFLAGLAMSTFSQNFQIIGKVRSLRDFFVTIFFVLLGVEMSFGGISRVLFPTLIFIFCVLILKPYLITLILGILGYKKRTSFFVGIHLAQISEFSLIVLYLGNSLGHISSEIISMVTTVALVAFASSTTVILQGSRFYKILDSAKLLFERKQTHLEKTENIGELSDHIVIVGGHQMGQSILHALKGTKEQAIVVDFDPDIIEKLKKNEIPHVFGDITDSDIQNHVNLENARLVISTVPDIEDSLLLIEKLNRENRKAKIIVVAYEKEDAKELYAKGADYVVMPHLAGGMHLAKLIQEKNFDHVKNLKNRDFMELL